MTTRPTILLVEDDVDIRENMTEFLESENYLVLAAPNGKVAHQLLEAAKELPLVILLDLMMPVLDGFGFCEQLRQNPRWAEVPVLLMTANGQAGAQWEALGAQGIVRKPVDIEDLSRRLKELAARMNLGTMDKL